MTACAIFMCCGKYRDVILPMTVIRRLDALLEDTKPAVLEMKEKLDAADIDNQWPALCNAAGQAFCNASPFLLKDLTSRAKKQTLKADFEAYLDGFSPNVKEILEKFKFRNQIDTMIEADILGAVIEKFVSSDINLSPNPIYKDEEKTILKHPGLDNHGMGTIFEELIRRFNEENNEEAGEHWTPRDVVELMADLIFMPIADQIKDATYSCYDGACGTGGMLTVAQERLQTLAARRGKNVSIHLFGQRSTRRPMPFARQICCSRAMANRQITSATARRCHWTETPPGSLISCSPIRHTARAGKQTPIRWAAKRRFSTPGSTPILKAANSLPCSRAPVTGSSCSC